MGILLGEDVRAIWSLDGEAEAIFALASPTDVERKAVVLVGGFLRLEGLSAEVEGAILVGERVGESVAI